jgi:uncharacterized surface protein with fasciclin (FAS1) repeats
MNLKSLGSAFAVSLAALTIGVAANTAQAQMGGMSGMNAEHTKMVGGAAMYPSRNIIQNAVNSKDHTTLVAAVKAAGLVDTLETPGPFTVFAPTNEAFAKLPAGAVASLLEPGNKDQLTAVLTYHVVPGRLTAADLLARVREGGGRAMIKTVQGEPLSVTANGRRITLTDAKRRASHVTIGDVMQSNGVIHVVDTVLLPA